MYDLAVIGAGAGGIECAKLGAISGFKTVLIEKNQDNLGGTCVNLGCIPTKFLLNVSGKNKSWEEAVKEKDDLLNKIKKPIIPFLQKSGIDTCWGNASFVDANTLKVKNQQIQAKNIIIATGSLPKNIFSDSKIITSGEVLTSKKIGNKILIIGAGYIGIEFACLFNAFNHQVTIIEKQKTILPTFETSLSSRLKIILQKRGINIKTAQDVIDYNLDDYDMIVSAVGRKPNVENLNPEKAGLALDKGGWLKTDSRMQSNIKNIYGCGDVTGKSLLAYVAQYQAKLCISNIKGENISEDYRGFGESVFSVPQIAKVGLSENQAKEKGINYKVIKSTFSKFSSSHTYGDSEGYCKIIMDEKGIIVGASIISKIAAELINLFVLCVRSNLSIDVLKKSVFIHPTLSEILSFMAEEA